MLSFPCGIISKTNEFWNSKKNQVINPKKSWKHPLYSNAIISVWYHPKKSWKRPLYSNAIISIWYHPKKSWKHLLYSFAIISKTIEFWNSKKPCYKSEKTMKTPTTHMQSFPCGIIENNHENTYYSFAIISKTNGFWNSKKPSDKSEKITKTPTVNMLSFPCGIIQNKWVLEPRKHQVINSKKSWKILHFISYHFCVVPSKTNEFGYLEPPPKLNHQKKFKNQNKILKKSEKIWKYYLGY